jgi:hypothetical protein
MNIFHPLERVRVSRGVNEMGMIDHIESRDVLI